MAITRRTVTIKATDFPGERIGTGDVVTFTLPCDLNDTDGTIIKAGSWEVPVPGSVDLPVYDNAVATQDGMRSWYIEVCKSWHKQHPYRIQVPAGSGSVALGSIPALSPLTPAEARFALATASVRPVPGTDWGGWGTVQGSNLALTLTVPDSPGGGGVGLGIVNVLTYGAVGDGVADDTAAIEAAANAAGVEGVVFFPPHLTFRTTRTITMPVPQRWIGVTPSQNTPNATAATAIKVDHNGIGVVCHSGHIQGIRFQGRGAGATGCIGIKIAGAATIQDVFLVDFAEAINMNQAWYVYLDRVFTRWNGLALRIDYCYNVSLVNFRVSGLQRTADTYGRGIIMTDRSMVKMHGGSIEQYTTGIEMGSDQHLYMSGVYMESYSPGAVGVKFGAQRSSLKATGCEVYLDNHAA
ncbi:hypothetical protein M3G03_09985 [Aestuariimicrobium sp. p3-SID1156]|uniref:glycosyl hydrolase family 28-related protein n=1 Tax=Aestuariimicrobium sp. p3-SID1156 TaxID=2916038 RepID=UPI00223B003D|nr:glycosyl hydrolase family 28-related protein [Aestuariimicrobium sp. p3-SID1156]MCT1459859.1 hypothetical protein [Aestuariimicrobium sp. p3-SID1156]